MTTKQRLVALVLAPIVGSAAVFAVFLLSKVPASTVWLTFGVIGILATVMILIITVAYLNLKKGKLKLPKFHLPHLSGPDVSGEVARGAKYLKIILGTLVSLLVIHVFVGIFFPGLHNAWLSNPVLLWGINLGVIAVVFFATSGFPGGNILAFLLGLIVTIGVVTNVLQTPEVRAKIYQMAEKEVRERPAKPTTWVLRVTPQPELLSHRKMTESYWFHAEIVRNDMNVFQITLSHPTIGKIGEMVWDKNQEYGTFERKYPDDSGDWYLRREQGQEHRFVGAWRSLDGSHGQWVPMEMYPVSRR